MKKIFKALNQKVKVHEPPNWALKILSKLLCNKNLKRRKAVKQRIRKESSQKRRWATLVLKTMTRLGRCFLALNRRYT